MEKQRRVAGDDGEGSSLLVAGPQRQLRGDKDGTRPEAADQGNQGGGSDAADEEGRAGVYEQGRVQLTGRAQKGEAEVSGAMWR